MTITDFLTRYDNKEKFTEGECRDLFWGDDVDCEEHEVCEVEEISHDKRRWSQVVAKYVRIDDRYFCFAADIGLTECQDNEYWIQPQEVRREQKVVVQNVWVEVPHDRTSKKN